MPMRMHRKPQTNRIIRDALWVVGCRSCVRERTGSTSVSLWYQLPAFGSAQLIQDESQIHIDFKPVLSSQGATPSLIFLFLDNASYFLMSHYVCGDGVASVFVL